MADDSLPVDQKGDPFGKAFPAQYAITVADLFVQVAKQGEGDDPEFFGEGPGRMDRVDADRQNLGVEPPENARIALQTGEFVRSDRCEGEGVEDQQDVGPLPV